MPNGKNSPNDIPIGELAENICLLLEMRKSGKLHEAVVRQVVKGAIWWVSNQLGKRDDCTYWSTKARMKRRPAVAWSKDELVHDHMVPRNLIEEKILTLEHPTCQAIEELLSLSIVCIITKDEDETLRKKGWRSTMPPGKNVTDVCARYVAADITIVLPIIGIIGSQVGRCASISAWSPRGWRCGSPQSPLEVSAKGEEDRKSADPQADTIIAQ